MLTARMYNATTIINAVGSIATTGRTSDPIALASQGRDSFVLQLAATPDETTDNLTWELRPLTFGGTTYLTTPIRIVENGTTSGPTVIPLTGSLTNPGTDGATYQFEFSGIHADSLQLWVGAADTNSAYTVTAKYRTLKYGP